MDIFVLPWLRAWAMKLRVPALSLVSTFGSRMSCYCFLSLDSLSKLINYLIISVLNDFINMIVPHKVCIRVKALNNHEVFRADLGT